MICSLVGRPASEGVWRRSFFGLSFRLPITGVAQCFTTVVTVLHGKARSRGRAYSENSQTALAKQTSSFLKFYLGTHFHAKLYFADPESPTSAFRGTASRQDFLRRPNEGS